MIDSEIKKTFSKNFNRLLTLHGKSQKDITDDLGYHRATVSEWARGAKYPRMDKVERLAEYFGVQISDLIEDKASNSVLPRKDTETDITKMIDDLKTRLNTPNLTFKGKLVTEEEKQAIINGMQIALEIALQKK